MVLYYSKPAGNNMRNTPSIGGRDQYYIFLCLNRRGVFRLDALIKIEAICFKRGRDTFCNKFAVADWLEKVDLVSAKRIWFVMDCGSEICNAAKYNRELAARKALTYMGTAQIVMPENYIALLSATPKASK